jgi:ribosome-associated translation inhibitor RaiA
MLTTRTILRDYTLNDLEAHRVQRHLDKLGSRLAGWPDPVATLLLTGDTARQQVGARLRVRLGHLGGHLVSRGSAETADHAVRLVTEQIERQFERQTARPKPRAQEKAAVEAAIDPVANDDGSAAGDAVGNR